jgi:hypothetical protein
MTPREQIDAARKEARKEAKARGRKVPRQSAPEAHGGICDDPMDTPEQKRYRHAPYALRVFRQGQEGAAYGWSREEADAALDGAEGARRVTIDITITD